MIKKLLSTNLYTLALYMRKIASAFVVFIAARFLDVHGYGLYSSYRTIALYILVLANLGFSEYIIVSSQKKVENVALKQRFFIVFGILVALFYACFQSFFNLENHLVFALLIFNMFFDNSFFALILPYFQVTKKFKEISLINIVYAVGIIAIACISYIFKLGLTKFLILNVLWGVFNFVQSSIRIKASYIKGLIQFKEFFKSLDKSMVYFALVALTILTYSQLPSLAVSTLLSREDAALYFSAFNIASVLALVSAAQSQQIIADLMSNSYSLLKKVLKKNILFVLKINIAATLFFIVAGKPLLEIIYGNEYYQNAYFALVIPAFAQTVGSVGAVAGTYITARNMQKSKFKMQLEFVAVTFLLLAALKKFGLTGMVWTFALSQIYTASRYTIFMLNDLKKLRDKEA